MSAQKLFVQSAAVVIVDSFEKVSGRNGGYINRFTEPIRAVVLPAVLLVCGCAPNQAVRASSNVRYDLCACPGGKAGAVASALCWRYQSTDLVEGAFELTDGRVAVHGVSRSRPGSPNAEFAIAGDTRDGAVKGPPFDKNWELAFGFLSQPLCRDAQVSLDTGQFFGYTRGPVLLAKSNAEVLVYIDAATETVHGVSVRLSNGERVRGRFLRWAFRSGSLTREVVLEPDSALAGPSDNTAPGEQHETVVSPPEEQRH